MNLSAIFYGTAIISDEVDGKGLTYLQMRPLSKSTILLSKFAAYLAGTVALIGASHLILTIIVVTHPKLDKNILFHFGMSLRYTATMALSLLTYGALAAALAAKFKHPVLWGLLFVMGWEGITTAGIMPTGIKRLSISHYLLTPVPPLQGASEPTLGLFGRFAAVRMGSTSRPLPSDSRFAVLAIRIFREREYLM